MKNINTKLFKIHLLSMIKDEEDVIERMLDSYMKLGIDSVYIFDTGSTDSTLLKINEWSQRNNMTDRVFVKEGTFVNYVHSKNELLKWAYGDIRSDKYVMLQNVDDYVLFSDADEYMILNWEADYYHDKLTDILIKGYDILSSKIKDVTTGDSGDYVTNTYSRVRFWKIPQNYNIQTFPYFSGPNVHEYIDCRINNPNAVEINIDDDFCVYHKHTPGKTDYIKRLKGYIRLLNSYIHSAEYVDDEPVDVPMYMRALYYLAASNNDLDTLDVQIDGYKKYLYEYEKYDKANKYFHPGERYHAVMSLALIYLRSGLYHQAYRWFLKLTELKYSDVVPRPEAYYYLCKLLFDNRVEYDIDIDKIINFAKLGAQATESNNTGSRVGFFVDYRCAEYCKNMIDVFESYKNENLKPEQKTIVLKDKYTINDYFDEVYLINLDRRIDRMKLVKNRLDKYGIKYKRINAYEGRLFDSMVRPIYKSTCQKLKGWTGDIYTEGCPSILRSGAYTACTLSHLHCMSDAKERNLERILILEDDIIINKNIDVLFDEFIRSVEKSETDWDVLYLGWVYAAYDAKKDWLKWANDDGSNHFLESNGRQLWCCHSYALNKNSYCKIIDYYKHNFDREIDMILNGIELKAQWEPFDNGIPHFKKLFSPHHLFLQDYKNYYSDNVVSGRDNYIDTLDKKIDDLQGTTLLDPDYTYRLNKYIPESIEDFE